MCVVCVCQKNVEYSSEIPKWLLSHCDFEIQCSCMSLDYLNLDQFKMRKLANLMIFIANTSLLPRPI